MKQYAALDDTIYLWFAANDTSGSGGDGASPAAHVRLAGAAADAAPVYSPTPTLLTHANYPAGAHEIAIAATAANGFAANNTYAVFCTLLVDSQNPTGFIGSFDLKPVESNVIQIGDAAQSATDLKDFVDTGYDPATKKIEACKVNDDMRGTDSANTTVPDAAGVAPTAAEIKTEVEQVGSSIAQILADTNELQGDWVNGGRLDLLLDAIPTTAMRGTDGANTTIPDAAGVAPTAAEIKTEMEGAGSSIAQILTDTGELQTDWVNGGRLDLLIDRILTATEVTQSSVNDPGGTATTTKFITALTETQNDFWNRMAIIFTSGNNTGQMRRIKDYDGSTKEVTLQTPLDAAPADVDTFILPVVRAFITPDIEDIADAVLDELTADHTGIGSLSKAIADTLADTGELQTDWVNGGRLDLLLDAIPTTAMRGTDSAALASVCTEGRLAELAAANLPADVTTILVDTNELQADWTNGGRLDLLIDAIKAETDNLPSGLQKNVALSNFSFLMTDSTSNEPMTGLTVTVQISKDGGAFANATNTPATEIANGAYKIDLTQAERNADISILKATAVGANQTTLMLVSTT